MATAAAVHPQSSRREDGRNGGFIFASSLGTVFEWYDFYLYATLAPFLRRAILPERQRYRRRLLSAFFRHICCRIPGSAALLRESSSGASAILSGRKYTFLVTINLYGAGSTVAVGLLPTYASIGLLAPLLLLALRLIQGLALGGEYGGAATYGRRRGMRPDDRRGYATSWIQTTATLGFFMSLMIILLCRDNMDKESFASWGWRYRSSSLSSC